MRELRPNPGPQEIFLATSADIAIYGGSAGAGKSFAVTMDILRHAYRKGFAGVVFRREHKRLIGGGSIWEEMAGIYPLLPSPATPKLDPLQWRFPDGGLIELHHMQYEADKHAHQGKQYAAIYFDELTEFTEGQFWYLLSRLRTTCGIRPYVRATCNPDPDSFVRRLIAWWIGADGLPIRERSGALRWLIRSGDDLLWYDSEDDARTAHPGRNPLSLTFIAATLADNPKGDPTYRDKLEALPRVDRERLLGGNWDVRAASGEVFRRGWFGAAGPVLDRDVAQRIRAWDLAATEPHAGNPDPDWTVGARIARLRDGSTVIEHVERFRGTPAAVQARIAAIASTDPRGTICAIPQDPGQAGKDQASRMVRDLGGKGVRVQVVRIGSDKVTYAHAWSALAEHGHVSVTPGPWVDPMLVELEAFPGRGHDDQVDALSLAFHVSGRAGRPALDGSRLTVGYDL